VQVFVRNRGQFSCFGNPEYRDDGATRRGYFDDAARYFERRVSFYTGIGDSEQAISDIDLKVR
jgi:hypothetical protein